METEDQLSARYQAELAAIAALDRRYYLTPSASIEERRAYAARQSQLEEMRTRFYAEIAVYRQRKVVYFRRCRSFIHKSRSRLHPA